MINSEEFLKELRDNRLKSYKATPGDIEEHRRAELRVAGDTAGRPLIELIQNADDAMNMNHSPGSGKNRIKIILRDKILLVANDGAPFSPEGVEAICNLDRSPKKDRRITIGNKGIGFKSVLSWTQKPTIYSRTFEFTYDRERACKDISKFLDRNYQANEVPLMRLPYHSPTRQEGIEALYDDGFATIIALELKNEKAYQLVLEELKSFDPLTLLFLNSVSYFLIESRELNRWYKITRNENQINIETDHAYETFKVSKIEREITNKVLSTLPEDCLDLTHGTIAIALPQKPLGDYPQIFSYFPTREKCPFRFFVHGDFILDGGRKHLREDAAQYNRWIIRELAMLFEKQVIPFFGTDNVSLIDFLECRSPEDMEVVEQEIFKVFSGYLGKKDFLPVMNNPSRLVAPLSACLAEEDILLEAGKLFEDEIQWEGHYFIEPEWLAGSRLQTLKKLGGKEFREPDFVKILGSMAKPDPSWCTKALYTIFKWIENAPSWDTKNNIIQALEKEKLLLTERGELRSLTDDNLHPLFLPPERDIKIPSFIHLDFLSKEIGKDLEGNESEFFVKMLKQLSDQGLHPFRPKEIIKKAIFPLFDDGGNIINSDDSKRKELLFFLVQLAPNEKKFRDTEPYPWFDDLRARLAYTVCVPTENGDWLPAWRVYAGEEWGAPAELIEIYKEDAYFLESPNSEFHKVIPIEKWKSLYRYLGVSWEPKILPVEQEPDYIAAYSFPNLHPTHISSEDWEQYRDYCKKDPELSDMWYGRNSRRELKESYVLDNWKKIKIDAKKSLNLFHLLYKTKLFDYIAGPQKSKIECNFRYTKISVSYPASCESVLLWAIKHSSWLPWLSDEDNRFYNPSEIFLESSQVGRSLKGLVPTFQIEMPQEKEDRRRLEDLLEEIGIRTNWDQLKIEDWESWLNKIKSNGEISKQKVRAAQTLYRHCLERCDFPMEEKPLSHVNVLALSSGNHYKFIVAKEVVYLDDPRFDPIRKKLLESGYSLFVIELGENRAKKAKKLFGMKLVSEIVEEKVTSGSEHRKKTEEWNKKFEHLKPVLLARLGKERPEKREKDEKFFQSIEICAVDNLNKSFLLIDNEDILFEDNLPACWSNSGATIFIDVDKKEKKLWSAIAECLAQRVGQTYYEAFENLLLCETDSERIEKLRKAGVPEGDVSYCENALNNKQDFYVFQKTKEQEEPVEIEPKTIGDPNLKLDPEETTKEILSPQVGKFVDGSGEMEIPKVGSGSSVGSTQTGRKPQLGKEINQKDKEIELAAMRWAEEYEKKNNRDVIDVSYLNLGYDLKSIDKSTGEKRYIEVKGAFGRPEKREITINEWNNALELDENYYIYYVLGLGENEGEMRIFKNPAKKVETEEKTFNVKLPKELADETVKFKREE